MTRYAVAMKPFVILALLFSATTARADPPEVVGVNAAQSGDGWRFDVTIAHPDSGWDHYADAWQIELADGTVLGTRVLVHPHETEQPFTRGLGGVVVPEGVTEVFVRARCLRDGWNGGTTGVALP